MWPVSIIKSLDFSQIWSNSQTIEWYIKPTLTKTKIIHALKVYCSVSGYVVECSGMFYFLLQFCGLGADEFLWWDVHPGEGWLSSMGLLEQLPEERLFAIIQTRKNGMNTNEKHIFIYWSAIYKQSQSCISNLFFRHMQLWPIKCGHSS